MLTIKCKYCGGVVKFSDGDTVGKCEYCQTEQTLPKTDKIEVTDLFDRANEYRMKCQFDDARLVYEKIIESNRNEAEAYWGKVLCKYGIEYVEDPKTGLRIPTCHRTLFESIVSDLDYDLAVKNSDINQKVIYESEAKKIDEIQKSILSIARNERPFDIFICYKETDSNGKRTDESVIAHDIFESLTKEGYKVFFARVTLEDKLGTAYEPYIFAALNSAKIMLTIGTKKENFEAVWVKNEWSRYLDLMKGDHSKQMIPCYKGMDPYNLPSEFSYLQAQDLSKLGYMQDLIRGIKKIIPLEDKKSFDFEKSTGGANPTSNSLLERAFIFLEEGDFSKADNYFEKVLDIEPKNGNAYFGKWLVSVKISGPSEANNYIYDMDDFNDLFDKAYNYGDSKIKNTLGDFYYKTIEKIISSGYTQVEEYKNSKKYLDGIKIIDERLKVISGYIEKPFLNDNRDSNIFKEYYTKYEILRTDLKKAFFDEINSRIDNQEDPFSIEDYWSYVFLNENEDATIIDDISKKLKKLFYKKGVEIFNTPEYIKSRNYFNKSKNYMDSEEYLSRINEKEIDDTYLSGIKQYDEGQYEECIKTLTNVKDYKNSNEILEQAIVNKELKDEELRIQREKERAEANKRLKKRLIKLALIIVGVIVAFNLVKFGIRTLAMLPYSPNKIEIQVVDKTNGDFNEYNGQCTIDLNMNVANKTGHSVNYIYGIMTIKDLDNTVLVTGDVQINVNGLRKGDNTNSYLELNIKNNQFAEQLYYSRLDQLDITYEVQAISFDDKYMTYENTKSMQINEALESFDYNSNVPIVTGEINEDYYYEEQNNNYATDNSVGIPDPLEDPEYWNVRYHYDSVNDYVYVSAGTGAWEYYLEDGYVGWITPKTSEGAYVYKQYGLFDAIGSIDEGCVLAYYDSIESSNGIWYCISSDGNEWVVDSEVMLTEPY
ncbi:MAG: toll/interleukin-1 receptor domain-containing protein [Bacteroidales bacterium]|nr:toll/interleukin-1 receptor domain-containing protein [Bacteroidales bacterium]